MPIDPQRLLNLARELVDRNAHGAPVEEDLRVAVHSAYYALFHLVTQEAMGRIVADVTLRARIARSLQHDRMKAVCQEYATAATDPVSGQLMTRSGQAIPSQLRDVGLAFVTLQDARHQSDYNSGFTLEHAEADTHVMTIESAFLDWLAVQADPATGVFLTELFLRSVAKR